MNSVETETNSIRNESEIIDSQMKKRRSRFDVSSVKNISLDHTDFPPPLPSEESFISTINTSFGSNVLQHSIDTCSKVEDEYFLLKLKRALEMNLEYIKKLDSQPLQIQIPSSQINRTYNFMNTSIPSTAGLGSVASNSLQSRVSNTAASKQFESSSIYISGLPKDITEEELEILFSVCGKIRKIKIYRDIMNQIKGDALVTFTKPEPAIAACLQFNHLNIDQGCIIQVTRANFTSAVAAEVLGAGNSAHDASVDNNDNEMQSSIDTLSQNIISEVIQEMDSNYTNVLVSATEATVESISTDDGQNIDDFLNSLL